MTPICIAKKGSFLISVFKHVVYILIPFFVFLGKCNNIFIEFFNILLCVSFTKNVPLGSTVTIVKRIVALTVEILGYVTEKLEVVRMHVKMDGKEANVSMVSFFLNNKTER